MMNDRHATRTKPLEDSDRLLLCVARGGLNDTLCQIEKCWRYAKKFSRTLVIDTRRSGLLGQFSDYFSLKIPDPEILTKLEPFHLSQLNLLDCSPVVAKGKIHSYKLHYSKDLRNFVERDTNSRLSFDFEIDYVEPLLVHEQCGGGKTSADLLNRVTLAPNILPTVIDSLAQLNCDYVGVHVRNTDYQTDYEDLFKKIYMKAADKNLLICSDDAEVVSRAKVFFDRSKVLTVTNMPHTEKKPLHNRNTYSTDEERKRATINSIIDLLALGYSTEIFFSNVSAGYPSGFSRLAMYLCENKSVIRSLLSNNTSAS